jgi:hypothetical protein
MATVKLRIAFSWTCEECRRDNFVAAELVAARDLIGADLSPIGPAADDDDSEPLCVGPEHVTCGHCGAGFATVES